MDPGVTAVSDAGSRGLSDGASCSTRCSSNVQSGPAYASYDNWGRHAYFQNCSRQEWHSYYGAHQGYRWACNHYGCSWQSFYDTRKWYYYNWVNYRKRV